MSTKDYLQKFGARKTAQKLVDQRIERLCGLSTDDLPDTSELCDIVDQLEELLDNVDGDELPVQGMKDILSNIDFDFIQEMVFS